MSKNGKTKESLQAAAPALRDDRFEGWSDEEKLQIIDGMTELKNVPMGCRPPCPDDNSDYYFVSYSHKDFKKVYRDIFALQMSGLNIWYDREMVYGQSWLDTAEKYIRNQHCLGVVFYVSENSVMSEAIGEEIKYAQKHDKDWCSVNLPLVDKKFGDSVGSELCGKDILDLIRQAYGENKVSPESYEFIAETLSKDILYVAYSASPDIKISAIRSIKQKPLFVYEYGNSGIHIKGVNNTDVEIIKKRDFKFADEQYDIILIKPCAIANCKYLKSVSFPKNLNFIGDYAFFGCKSLYSVCIPLCTSHMGIGAFSECVDLKKFDAYDSRIDVIQEKTFSGCSSLNEIKLPKNLGSINDFAFKGCTSLREINIPSSVTNIGWFAFGGCTSLKEINIPNNVESISYGAFGGCTSLKEINLPNSVTSIGDHAFDGCKSLREITIPNSVKSIETWVFDSCTSLTKITIPDSVVYIDDRAFGCCTSLYEITISNSVMSIGKYAFVDCKNLTEVNFTGTMREWMKIELGDRVFRDTQVKAIHCTDGDLFI